jgi:hypothetical protein
MIRRILSLYAFLLVIVSPAAIAQTNDFYDDAPTNTLKGSGKILVTGEIEKDTVVDFSTLPQRNTIVKETRLDGGKVEFTGAYRYNGVSLYDILNNVVIKKKNATDFSPIIDLYVEVSNDAGEKVLISWGEIYYPNNRHNIIIATSVARIVPSKTKEQWPLPTDSKLVVGNDLVTERNLSNPTKIKVRSLDCNYTVNKGMNPMWSDKVRLCVNSKLTWEITQLPEDGISYTYNTVFYGRGMGIHGTSPFTGQLLKNIIAPVFTLSKESLRTGMVVVVGLDGYRAAYTLSEIVNRNDQQEILMYSKDKKENNGHFLVFPSCDFFSDRAIKAVMEINLLIPGKQE